MEKLINEFMTTYFYVYLTLLVYGIAGVLYGLYKKMDIEIDLTVNPKKDFWYIISIILFILSIKYK